MTWRPVVVDASVAAKWQLRDEEHIAEADRLRDRVHAGELRVIVPSFWVHEMAGIFSKAVANRRMTDAEARTALLDVLEVPAEFHPFPSPLSAYEAARRFNRSVIDCFYVALAEERRCDFWSDDRKLCRTLGPRHAFVRWIGDYAEVGVPPAS